MLAGAAALAASWQRWINPLIDSGRELDVPWRLNQGERLYQDITYYYGPLGPWLDALALRLFGSRWTALQAVCLVASAAIFALTYRLTRQAGGSRLAAVTATSMAAVLCMGAPNGGAFIFPYSSSGLFALASALLALGFAAMAERPLNRWIAAAALAVALGSRIEVGFAAAVAIVLAGARSRPRRETLRNHLVVVAAGSIAAAAVFGVALWGLDWQQISHDGPLIHLTMPREWHTLYLDVAGLAAPLKSGSALLISVTLDGALLVLLACFALPRFPALLAPLTRQGAERAAAGLAVEPRRRLVAGPAAGRTWKGWWLRRYLAAATMLALLVAYLKSPAADPFKNLPPLTLALPLLVAAAAVAMLRRPLVSGEERARFLLFSFSAALASRVFFGLTVGPKMSPYATLPLPGLLAAVAVLAFDRLAPRLPDPASFRRRLVVLMVAVAGIFLYRIDRVDHRPHTGVLATSAGELRLPTREVRTFDQTLRYLRRRAHPGDMLTAFPESGFFNFLTGLRSPLRQDQMLPGMLAGDREIEAARLIHQQGPRFVLLCNRPSAEYGLASFGRDYDVRLWRQVEQDYALAAAFGWARPTAPVGAGRFFVRVYERQPRLQTPNQRLAQGPAETLETGRFAPRQVPFQPAGAAPLGLPKSDDQH